MDGVPTSRAAANQGGAGRCPEQAMSSLRSIASVFPARFAGRGLLGFVSAGALLACTNDLPGAEPTLLDHSICSEVALNDGRLTVYARRALAEDESLASLNLGVSVRNHVATIWGPVPSAELGQRALDNLRRVPGLAQVVNQLVIEKPGDPLLEFLRPPASPPSTSQRLTPGEERGAERRSHLAVPPCLRHTEAGPCPASGAAKSTAAPENTTVFMPLIPLPVRTPAGPPSGTTGLADAVEKLRRADQRYWRIAAEVVGGTVHLRGVADSREDVFALARAVSHVPGVERVVVAEVRCQK